MRWAKRSLEKLRLGGSRRGERAAPPAPQRCQAAAQRQMLHCVAALHQFAADRVLQSAGRTLSKVSQGFRAQSRAFEIRA